MRIVSGFDGVSLEKFSEKTMESVCECRQTVGYQEDMEWECPYLGDVEHQMAFQERHQGKHVGGFLCYPCFVKETKDWQSRGLPIPVKRTT